MATLIIKKPTAGDLFINDLGIIIPGSGQDTFTDPETIRSVVGSVDLRDFVTSGTLVVNNGTQDLAAQLGLIYLSLLWTQAGFDTPADKIVYVFGTTFAVPTAGTQQLLGPGNTLAPYRMPRNGRITAASVQVNIVDTTNAYDLQIRINGVTVSSINLPANTLGVNSNLLNAPVLETDLLTVFLVRTAGAGGSDFTEVNAMVEINTG